MNRFVVRHIVSIRVMIGKLLTTVLAPRRNVATLGGLVRTMATPTPTRTEVQAHGFQWEKELMVNVYGATMDELKQIRYTHKVDLPAAFNRLDGCDLSIKTSCRPNMVCMADCLRIFDATGADTGAFRMVVVHYTQDDAMGVKRIARITELELAYSRELLFGTLTREQIETLDAMVKRVPAKRKPTEEEYNDMYALRDELQACSEAIHLDIKCNSTQSRLQCSFHRFQEFMARYPSRVIATSETNAFRGGIIVAEIQSSRRVFRKKQTV